MKPRDITPDLMIVKSEPEEEHLRSKAGQYCTLGLIRGSPLPADAALGVPNNSIILSMESSKHGLGASHRKLPFIGNGGQAPALAPGSSKRFPDLIYTTITIICISSSRRLGR